MPENVLHCKHIQLFYAQTDAENSDVIFFLPFRLFVLFDILLGLLYCVNVVLLQKLIALYFRHLEDHTKIIFHV